MATENKNLQTIKDFIKKEYHWILLTLTLLLIILILTYYKPIQLNIIEVCYGQNYTPVIK